MAFMTAASPCALAIGTPAAVLCGIARAARGGVLIKGGGDLENLARIDAIAFDKTGTLTTGQLAVTDIARFSDESESELLAIAAALEMSSSHPLARAIVKESKARNLAPISAIDVEQRAGSGIFGTVNGRRISIGNRALVEVDVNKESVLIVADRLAGEGKTIVTIVREQKTIGLIALADRLRDEAASVIRSLKNLGVKRTLMLTGDHRAAADSIAHGVGVDEHHAELLPADKLNLLQKISGDYRAIAMVGDGINDAPALAQATLGIAMGGANSDVAMEAASVVLMGSTLARLPFAIALGRAARRIISQNLVIALGVIAIVAPIAALGGATLGVAVLLHEGSTVLVVCNALRILSVSEV
jgi:Cd2+/Zn2+-exporting ATPase